MSPHWVIRFGYTGETPTELVEDSYDSAVESLASRFKLDELEKEELIENDRIELAPEYGVDYCELEECDCADADNHS